MPVSDYELASRLSYFLWSSMPDEELLRLAERRHLRQPAVLEAQVRRMLRDEKARALVENFAGQWLQFRNIDVVRPDGQRFPGFRRQPALFHEARDRAVRREHRAAGRQRARFPRRQLLVPERAPGAVLRRPRRHGPEFRKVDMSGTERGGGILAQASILTISSYATRTSPVLRGKWILENLLNAPPPPPPPAVPALDDTKVGQSASLRQQMEAHRAERGVRVLPFEDGPARLRPRELNAIGAWRDEDGKFPVDASGLLPGGRSFQGSEGTEGAVDGTTATLSSPGSPRKC